LDQKCNSIEQGFGDMAISLMVHSGLHRENKFPSRNLLDFRRLRRRVRGCYRGRLGGRLSRNGRGRRAGTTSDKNSQHEQQSQQCEPGAVHLSTPLWNKAILNPGSSGTAAMLAYMRGAVNQCAGLQVCLYSPRRSIIASDSRGNSYAIPLLKSGRGCRRMAERPGRGVPRYTGPDLAHLH